MRPRTGGALAVAALSGLAGCWPRSNVFQEHHQALQTSPYEVHIQFSTLGGYYAELTLAPERGRTCEDYRLVRGHGGFRARLAGGDEHAAAFAWAPGALRPCYSGNPHLRDALWLSSCEALLHVDDRGFRDVVAVDYTVEAKIESGGRVRRFNISGSMVPGRWRGRARPE